MKLFINYLCCIGLAIIIMAAVCGSMEAGARKKMDKPLRLLTVGNSFSQNACQYLDELAKAGGHSIIFGHADIGGCPLDKHLALAKIAESDPDDPAGKPYGESWPVVLGKNPGRKSLKEMLTMEKWDIITIQQYSWISNDYSTYQPYGKELCEYIRKYAPQAEIVVHETWAYRCDDPRFASWNDSQTKMHIDLHEAYTKFASELGLRMIPVGDAFFMAEKIPNWRYKPAGTDVTYPNLPDQTHSLHAGWFWAKNEQGVNELQMDGHHASALGCYLASCVWYEFLFNESVVNNGFVPSVIEPDDAKLMQQIASKVLHENRIPNQK